jgi:hypothetical protein
VSVCRREKEIIVLEFAPISFFYSLLKDGVTAFKHRLRLNHSQILALRQKWKPIFETYIWEKYKKGLSTDVIIRDMKRIDSYPDANETKGISPWFRAGLFGTYHRGIYVGLRWATLTKDHDGKNWRYTNYAAGEEGEIKVILLGSIPYENIEGVDWEGDEYYSFPHIYCFFDHKKEPYEHVGFYTENRPPNGRPYYIEIAPFDQVSHRSKRLGIENY